MSVEEIKKHALKEIKEDDFRLAVDKYKEKLRLKKSLWDKIWPWKIVVLRKD